MKTLWLYHRAPVVIAAMTAGLIVLAGLIALVIRLSGVNSHPSGRPEAGATASASGAPTDTTSGKPGTTPEVTPSDVASWDAIPPVAPATSPAYPAVPAAQRTQADAYVTAWITELFTRDYHAATRAQLLAWAQYESAPPSSTQYPKADMAKVLVDSLTDPTWDDAPQTPVPAAGQWLSLGAQQTTSTIADVRSQIDPDWQTQLAGGYQPPDPLSTVRDVSATVTLRTVVAGRPVTSTSSIAIKVFLGSSTRDGGYAVLATGSYTVASTGTGGH